MSKADLHLAEGGGEGRGGTTFFKPEVFDTLVNLLLQKKSSGLRLTVTAHVGFFFRPCIVLCYATLCKKWHVR